MSALQTFVGKWVTIEDSLSMYVGAKAEIIDAETVAGEAWFCCAIGGRGGDYQWMLGHEISPKIVVI